MNPDKPNIDLLLEKLDQLEKQQLSLQNEINSIRQHVKGITPDTIKKPVQEEKPVEKVIPAQQEIPKVVEEVKKPKPKINFEKFIGENLINKIGIAILVIGVGIGAKYAIENELLNPLTRIIMGYIVGAALLFFAIRLKNKYKNYSAVLLSGSMAIFYFITFMASSFYNLIPTTISFAMMVMFTAFTVVSALHYNQKIIALLGLVGAYGVPFLLSDNSGRFTIFFSYVSLINVGILIVAIKKYWKLLYFTSFGLTWLIYLGWYFFSYDVDSHYTIAWVFLIIPFITFYLTALAYKLLKGEVFNRSDIVLITANSLLFYGVGYSLFESKPELESYLGLFTILNAIIHFTVAIIIKKRKAVDKQLFYFIAGMVLVFITVTIPVQLEGNPVTVLWVAEAVLLFWIGRTKKISVYEMLSYPMVLIAFISQIHDWTEYSDSFYLNKTTSPLFNVDFLGSILFSIGMGIMYYLHQKHPLEEGKIKRWMSAPMPYITGGILLIALFNSFHFEIDLYWSQLYEASRVDLSADNYDVRYNYRLLMFKNVWLINYFLVFTTLLLWANQLKIKNQLLAIISTVLAGIACLLFLTDGLYDISELREYYLRNDLESIYPVSFMYIAIRYISLAILGGLVFTSIKSGHQFFSSKKFKVGQELITHVIVLWVVSSELLHWMDIYGVSNNYKLGLSILWGVYALIMVILGIWKNNKVVRIAAIALFGSTLIKLFFYDISHLNLISKAIVFIALGVLLLLISFLYNKYKNSIFEDGESK